MFKFALLAVAVMTGALGIEHVCLDTVQCVIEPLGLPKRLADIDIDVAYDKAKTCMAEAGCTVPDGDARLRRDVDAPIARFRRGLTDIEGINKTCALEFMKDIAKEADTCLHDGERSLTANDKVINLYMGVRACTTGKLRKAALCLVKQAEVDINDVKSNAHNIQPCPCIASASDACKQWVSDQSSKVCTCINQVATDDKIAAFEERCGALNDEQRAKATEGIEKVRSRCDDPLAKIAEDVHNKCPDLADFSMPAAAN